MPHAITIANPGLQALILCGPGSSFGTFTSNPDENPKAILPIANRPMVWYPLEFCYRAGITNITLVCPPSARRAIETALNTNPFLTSLPLPRPDLLSPKGLDQTTGTAEILRLPEVQDAVTSDFFVLPCDVVCELGADKLLQAWMVQSASLSDLLANENTTTSQRNGGFGVWYETKTATPVKGEETDFLALSRLPGSSTLAEKGSLLSNLSKLVYSMPTDSLKDLVDEKSGLPMRHTLLRQHPNTRMLATHRDAHIYIFPRWVMDFVRENDRLETIGEDVIGWWAKAGWQKGLSTKIGLDKALRQGDADKDETTSSDNGNNQRNKPTNESPDTAAETQTSSPDDSSVTEEDDQGEKQQELPVPPIIAYLHPTTGPLIRRVDTAPLLLQVSLQLAKLPSIEETGPDAASPFAHAKKVAYPEGVKPRTTISKGDSLIADNVTVQEKTSIKECVIGAGCQIGEGAKLLQCLLMDGVVVGKGCKLTKCVLGRRSEIGEGCVLTECEVQENLLVEAKTESKGENFMSSSGLEATEQDFEEGEGDENEMDVGEGEEGSDGEVN